MDNDQMLNRAFDEIDAVDLRVEKLSKIVYEQATTMGLISKIVMGLVMAVLIAVATMIFTHVTSDFPKKTIEDVVKKTIELQLESKGKK